MLTWIFALIKSQKTVKNRVWLCASCWFWCSMFGDDVVIFTIRLGCQFTIHFLSLSVLFFMLLLQLGRLLRLSQEFLIQIFRFSFSPSSFHSNLSRDTQFEIYMCHSIFKKYIDKDVDKKKRKYTYNNDTTMVSIQMYWIKKTTCNDILI